MSHDDPRAVEEAPPPQVPSVTLAAPAAIAPSAQTRSWGMTAYLLFILAACAVPLAFTLYSGNIWEDYLITFRHSQNLAEGKGLVFNPPERIHGFTSPLGTLLPALCHWVSGSASYLVALWWFRVPCILAFAGAGVLVLRSLPTDEPGARWQWLALALLYLVEPKSVIFTTNGMETAFMLLWLGWALWLFRQGWAEHWLAVGLCWAGLMWTRPDSPLYIASLSVAVLAFGPGPWRKTLAGLVKSALVCTIVYLPWFVWAWLYYGSPLPHTVVAKSNLDAGQWDHVLERLGELPSLYFVKGAMMFLPTYPSVGLDGWLPGTVPVAFAVAVFASCYWLVPVPDPLGRLASLSFALMVVGMHFYRLIFTWYMPPVALLGTVAVVRGVFVLARRLGEASAPSAPPRIGLLPALGFALLLALALDRLVLLGQLSFQLRVLQTEIEMPHRAQIGLWLKEHSKPGDSVYMEPLGYIGYFSGLRAMDAVGLVSPGVVQLRREHRYDLETLEGVTTDLQPSFVVLRPHELPTADKGKVFYGAYEEVKVFDARARLAQYEWIPGRGILDNEAVYHIFKRKS